MKIGPRIRNLRKAAKMTILELATAIGSDVGNISRLETGKQGYTEATITKIAEALGVEVADLFTDKDIEGKGKIRHSRWNDSYVIECLDVSVSAGPGAINNQEFVEVIRSIEYSPEEARRLFGNRPAANVKMINVRGDSMSGTIEPGDLIFVDVSVQYFDGDGIYAFLYDDTAHVKRLQKMKSQLLVLSDSDRYRTWDPIENEEMNRMLIYGKVIGSVPQSYRRHG
ncbi:transcriptional regulator [Yersinia ruckeri]|uniref:XRE family transcriptional regulator n=1 Tax=Yersinia ruckeri TaxID=29486 RepID=UPI0004E37DF6|nr:S24 family peptidase [Yersinia ruckeri]ARZ01779.1 HTH-type transcriptional repressor RghR [Yersinia ruckeri]EKN4704212.1 helix-turn-helix transcriptional regulator [Yersinia ruckeri]KFE38531.1 regulatory protein [Yersinia ruckeri]OIX32770.1 transcriptional regulator [Yersinia ruckeri]OIX32988.1 transcriptional regulator [Yersinia ruckeri]